SAADILDACHREQIAKLGGVKDVVSLYCLGLCSEQVLKRDRDDAIAAHLGADGLAIHQDRQLFRCDKLREHLLKHGQPDARLKAKPRDIPAAGVEMCIGAGTFGEREMRAIEL